MSTKPRVYAIGGAPRAGKSTVEAGLKLYLPGIPHFASDEVRAGMWQTLRPREAYPELFQQHFDHERFPNEREWLDNVLQRDGSPDYFIDRHYKQNEAVGQLGFDKLVRQTAEQAGRVIARGVVVRAGLIHELSEDFEVHAALLGNENPAYADTMVDIVHEANSCEENWLYGRSDEWVTSYMGVARLLSERTREIAKEHNIPYFDMGSGDFQHNVQQVIGHLTLGEPI